MKYMSLSKTLEVFDKEMWLLYLSGHPNFGSLFLQYDEQ